MVDSATARRLKVAEPSFEQLQQNHALNSFLAGAGDKKEPTVLMQSRVKGRKRGPRASCTDDDAALLANFLMERKQRVTVNVAGVSISFRACVHVDAGALTLVMWGEDATSLRLNAEGAQLSMELEDGRVFYALFLGLQVSLGLHGTLIGFSLVSNG